MRRVSECLVCGATTLRVRRALVSPFLASRIWNRKVFRVELAECISCGFAFYNPRLEPEEEQRLYAGYRTPAYQQMRYRFEPYYTEAFNANLFSEAAMEPRREALRRILSPHLARTQGCRILDFGGGRGELISNLIPGALGYSYDVSDAEPVPGICKLKSPAECKLHRYELIICSNVLEHVAFPRDLLRQVAALAAPGTLIFLEVPYEFPLGVRAKFGRILDEVNLLLKRPRAGLRLIGRGMSYVMHEHVNFFCPTALAQLAQYCGLPTQAGGEYSLEAKMLWALTRRSESGQLREV